MGNTQPHKPENQLFKAQDWQQVQWEPFTNIKDPTYSSNFEVLVNKHNPHLEIEKYQLYFNSRAEYISYLEIFYERKKYPNLVNSIHIEQTTSKSMCSTFLLADVYLERIHFRLFELIEIPVEEGLFMIDSTLEGYEKMFSKTGYFEISSDMIGVNKQGKVKVWFNKNFAKNFPEFNKIDHNKTQSDFILNLTKMIEESIDFSKGIEPFSKFLRKKNITLTFAIARASLKQYYAINKLCSQRAMKSIILWFKKNNRKNSFAGTQYNHLKGSSYSFKSTSNKKNQDSRKTLVQPNTKKIGFSKFKAKKYNDISHQQHQRPLNTFNLYSIPAPVSKENVKEREVSLERTFEQQRYNFPANFNNIGVIRMPFMKHQRKAIQLDGTILNDQTVFLPLKNINQQPPASFTHKSGGLYSPQSIQAKQNQWFRSKIALNDRRQRRIDSRKSMVLDTTQDLDERVKFYYTSDDTHQIDPDIVRDLYFMQNMLN